MTIWMDYDSIRAENQSTSAPAEMSNGKNRIDSRIDALNTRVGRLEKSSPAPAKTQLPARLRKNWIPISTLVIGIVGLVLAYFAWWQPWSARNDKNEMDHEIDAQLAAHQFNQMVSDIGKIKGQLSQISSLVQILAANAMKQSASLPAGEFQKQLPTVAAALQAARATNLKTGPAVIEGIRARLVKSEQDQPGFWSAASALINYESPRKPGRLPPCLAAPPVRRLLAALPPGATSVPVSPPRYENCEIDLDSQIPPGILDHVVAAGPVLTFWNCTVVYKGGPIPLLARYQGLSFTDCTFYLAVSQEPPDKGRSLVTNLLVANGTSQIKVGNPAGS